jgi:SPP1 gp7 family putative phage head morphogenesis protein
MANVNTQYYELLLEQKARLVNFEEKLKNDVFKIIDKVKKQIIAELAQGEIDPKMITDFKKTRLNNYLKQFDTIIYSNYKDIDQLTFDNLVDLGSFSTNFVANSYKKILKADIIDKINIERIKLLVQNKAIEGKTNSEWWLKQADNVKQKFNEEMTIGLTRNETIGELTKRVKGSIDQTGLIQISKRNAEALVRTSVIDINNTVSMQTYKENADVIGGIEWISTLDNRTTVICAGLDGLQWDLDFNPIGHKVTYPGQTAHWNCRSTQIPILKPLSDISKNLKEEIPTRTRSSIDGAIEKKTYEEWLKTKPVEFQNDVLGEKKAELWRNGEIKSIKDLVSQNGRELTLKQIEEKFL